jgi:hypothetical protein
VDGEELTAWRLFLTIREEERARREELQRHGEVIDPRNRPEDDEDDDGEI